jgi:hypothetical protein
VAKHSSAIRGVLVALTTIRHAQVALLDLPSKQSQKIALWIHQQKAWFGLTIILVNPVIQPSKLQ